LIETSRINIESLAPQDIDGVRNAGKPLLVMSEVMNEKNIELKKFLHSNLYQHERVQKMSIEAKQIIRILFDEYMASTELLPHDVQIKIADNDEFQHARIIADYIAGMTDRFAYSESERINKSQVQARIKNN
jgi:dGTPase